MNFCGNNEPHNWHVFQDIGIPYKCSGNLQCPRTDVHEPHSFYGDEAGKRPLWCIGIKVPVIDTSKVTFMESDTEVKIIPKVDRLSEMFGRQAEFQKSLGHDFPEMMEEERVWFAKDTILALLDEMHEALAEMGWKPWATSRHFNRDAFVGELIDAWHFLMNLFLVADCSPEEMYAYYLKKNAKNRARQIKGYDGVTDKCPSCKRAYDDDAVNCFPAAVNRVAYCAQNRELIG